MFATNHVPNIAEARFFFQTLAWGLMVGGMAWLVYLALEPYARRLWPDILISWSRLLAGRVRDRLIGRDLLIGGAIGCAAVLINRLSVVLPRWWDLPLPEPTSGPVGGFPNGTLTVLDSVPKALAMLSHLPQLVVSNTLAGIFLLILIRVIVRKPSLAVAVTFMLIAQLDAFAVLTVNLSVW